MSSCIVVILRSDLPRLVHIKSELIGSDFKKKLMFALIRIEDKQVIRSRYRVLLIKYLGR